MKKYISILLIVTVIFSLLTACGKKNVNDPVKLRENDTAIESLGDKEKVLTAVDGPSDFKKAGLPEIDVFDGNTDVYYYNVGDKFSQINFTDRGYSYTYRAIKGDDFVHGYSGTLNQTATFAINNDVKYVGFTYSVAGSDAIVGVWKYNGVSYSITCENGAVGTLIGLVEDLAMKVTGANVERITVEESEPDLGYDSVVPADELE